jgi:xanthine permease
MATSSSADLATRGRHPVDQMLPAQRLIPLGLQHVLIMYAGTVAVPIIVGSALKLDTRTVGLLVNADLFVAGIATLIQAIGIGKILGIRLPIVAGATFSAVTPMILIGSKYGLPAMYGAMICSGVFGLLIAKPFSKLLKFFPPLVTGTVITAIGLSLIGAAAGLIAGNDPTAKDYGRVRNILLAVGIILLIVLINRLFRGFVSQIAVLIGLLVGTIIAFALKMTDFSSVGSAAWLGLARPLRFGAPEFKVAAIISMCIVILVTYTESTADMLAVAEAVDKKVSDSDIARGLATDGFSALLGGFMNSFPDTAYAQNVGLVTMTRVRSRWVVAVAGVVLFLLGLVPKLGEIVASVPQPVVGGAALVMFAMVTAVGIRTLQRVPFTDNNNLLVVATSLGVGLLPVVSPKIYAKFPDNFQVIFSSSITSTVIVVFILNLFFNHLRLGARDSAIGVPGEMASDLSPALRPPLGDGATTEDVDPRAPGPAAGRNGSLESEGSRRQAP